MIAPRLRFAPSPTGYLHIGGVRTALFNWLMARHFGGTFILRIEDTDRSRSIEESIQAILDGLSWLGITWDEGPHRQTDRLAVYQAHAERLLAEGRAYRCYCTPEELEERRKEALTRKESPSYDGRCWAARHELRTAPFAIRFRTPTDGETVIHDLVKGKIVFNNAILDDLVIVRRDGLPTYNFSVVIDDALMGITHVVRGDDHLNNTPRQVQIYNAFGFSLPQFAHLPMILGPDKARLSKRHGAMSVTAYQEMGYLPEALVNYLARLGWSHGDQEIFSIDELIRLFSLDDVIPSAAVFNPEKLLWVNAQHLHRADPERVVTVLLPILSREGIIQDGEIPDRDWMLKLVTALQIRWQTVVEMAKASAPYLRPRIEMDGHAKSKFLTPAIRPALENLAEKLKDVSPFTHETIEPIFQRVLQTHHLKMAKLAQPVRVALTGQAASPGIYEVMELLGQERTCERLQAAISLIQAEG